MAARDVWLLAGAALLLAACLFEPRLPAERDRFEHVVVLDVTQSMNVEDRRVGGKPASRLAAARAALREALLALPCGSRVGWAVFTEYRSFLLFAPVEVCANLGELRATLDRIDGRMAWSGNSEVAKGLHSARLIVGALPERPSLVFVTDGHEAPPLNPRHRPAFDDRPGEVRGVIIGVGGAVPAPIPKTDPTGRPIGFWGPDEVLQVDPRSLGRGGSVRGEALVESSGPVDAAALGATPGSEHLSALHEGYLRLLAGEQGLAYATLEDTASMTAALTAPALARPVTVPADLRVPLGALALALLVCRPLRWRGRWAGRA